MHYGAPPGIFAYARQLRKNPTEAEKKLWKHLRKEQLGVKFRRQHPIWIYIADFFCYELVLIIEVDGSIHLQEENIRLDMEREYNLLYLDLHIIRFTNDEVLLHIEDVIEKIQLKLNSLRTRYQNLEKNPHQYDPL